MSPKAQKLILVGLDGAMPEMVLKFCEEGSTPHTASLMKRGVFARALPCPPVDTPTNWTTIATGAWPGTHGITSFTVHFPGDPLDMGRSTVELNATRLCRAEYLWDTAGRAGKKCLVLNYISSWPATSKNEVLVGGPSPRGDASWGLGPAATFTTEMSEGMTTAAGVWEGAVRFGIRPKRASGWKNVPPSRSPALEVAIPGNFTGGGLIPEAWQEWRHNEEPRREPLWRPSQELLILDSEGAGYDTVAIYAGKESEKPMARLRVDGWSPWLYDTFETGNGRAEGTFKFRLNSLSADGKRLELHRTPIYKTTGWTQPEALAREIVANVGPYAGGFEAYFGERESMGPDHPKYMRLYYEHVEQQCNYLADLAAYLKRRYHWDVLITQIHVQDEICHQWGFDGIDPTSPTYDPDTAEEHWQVLRRIYQITDNWIGRIVQECADPETLVVALSDHAAIPIRRLVPINRVLAEAGLLAFKTDPKTGEIAIDWSKTKAYHRPGFPYEYIWVNVRGRDPHGIVEPGREYRETCDRVITALYSVKDTQTGVCPIALALRREDAAILGQWGDRVADILYFFTPGYSRAGGGVPLRKQSERVEDEPLITDDPGAGNHSGYLPTAELGGCSNAAFFVMAGPGVKRGYRRPRPMWLVDVSPTVSHLLGIPPPAQSEGAVLYDMLE